MLMVAINFKESESKEEDSDVMEWSGKEEVFNYGVFRMIRAEGGGNTGGSPFRVDGWWQNNETFAV